MDLIGGGLRPWFRVTPGVHNLVMAKVREARAAARRGRQAWLPPRWFVVLFWHGHRALLRATRGRLGLWRPKPGRWGALRLTTTGWRTGGRARLSSATSRTADLVTMAMNGWGAAEARAWWLNLQACPDATVRTRDGARQVRARRAEGSERERLWARWAAIDKNLEAYAARRPAQTAVVVFEPRDAAGLAAGPRPDQRAAASPEGGASSVTRRPGHDRRLTVHCRDGYKSYHHCLPGLSPGRPWLPGHRVLASRPAADGGAVPADRCLHLRGHRGRAVPGAEGACRRDGARSSRLPAHRGRVLRLVSGGHDDLGQPVRPAHGRRLRERVG